MLKKTCDWRSCPLFLLALALYFIAYEYVYPQGEVLQEGIYPILSRISRATGISEIYNTPHILLNLLPYLLVASGVLVLIEAGRSGLFVKKTFEKIVLLWVLPFAAVGEVGGSLRWLLQNFWVELIFIAAGVTGSVINPNADKKALLPAVLLSAYAYTYGKNPAGLFVLGYAYGLAAEPMFNLLKKLQLPQKVWAACLGVDSRHSFILIFILAAFLRAWNLTGDVGYKYAFSDGYNAYAPYEIMQGKTLYRDFIYTHVPLVPYSIAAVYYLFGTGLLQARIFNLLVNLLSILPLYLLTKRWFGKNEALLASFLWAIYPNAITTARYVGHESPMTLFILISVLIASGGKTATKLFFSGAALGIATISKEPSLLLLIPFGIYFRDMGKKALPWLLGLLTVVLPVLAYFTAVGGKKFLGYNVPFHLALPLQPIGEKMLVFFTETYSLDPNGAASIVRGLLVVFFSAIGIYRATIRKKGHDVFMLLWFFSVLLLLFNHGFWWHYPLQLMPPLLLFTAIGILHTATGARRKKGYAYIGALIMVVLLLQEDYARITEKDDSQAIVAEALKNLTAKDELVLSSLLGIPLLAERNVPGELFDFGYQNALTDSDYMIWVAEKEHVAAIIMDANVNDEQRAKEFTGFREYVKKNYRKAWQANYTYWANDEISIWVRERAGSEGR